MAIAFDSATNASFGGSAGTSKTFSHTCSGSDRYLFVNTHTDSNVVTGVTYNGVAMTLLQGQATDYYNTVWGLVAPATGTNNVVISCSSSVNIIPNAVSYTGVAQSTPTIKNTFSTTGSTLTGTLTTTVDNSWLMMFVRYTLAGTCTPSAGSTERVEDSVYGFYTYDSGPNTPAGSSTVGMNDPSGGTKYGIAVAFAPTAPTSSIKSVNGLAIASVKSKNGLAIASIKSINGLSNVS